MALGPSYLLEGSNMAQKELYELKKNSIKTKYSNKIAELNNSNITIEELTRFKEEALKEIKTLKDEKYKTIIRYEKKIKYYTIIADILLFLGIFLFGFGLYIRFRMKVDSNVPEILSMVFGGVFMFVAAIFYGIVMQYRQKKQEYLKESISETELVATKKLINEFYDSMVEKLNNLSL